MNERVSEFELYKRASQYGDIHKKLAVLIAPYLEAQWDIADIGCGSGAIDFFLAEHVRSITAIDIDSEKIDALKADVDDALSLHKSAAARIFPEVADERTLVERSWDMILLCFHARPANELAALMSLARKRAIFIVHEKVPSEVFVPLRVEAEKCTSDLLDAQLKMLGCRYQKETVELPFGQPFRSVEEIHDYLGYYSKRISDYNSAGILKEDAEKILRSTEDRIIKTNRYDYPYYLPRSLSAGIFIVVT
ncbi:MAG: class I SAM-dependent methyltransferase [Clostridiales Family XIII bacterium]|jgi:SAM-dependent methyltransferase|nr:class I SAM-dependent methyltransferase [Clostridiales Family XIII bacterium]